MFDPGRPPGKPCTLTVVDSLKAAWRAEPRDVRRRVAKALGGGQGLDDAREATLAVWYANEGMRNQPRTAGVMFLVVLVLSLGSRVLVDGNSATQAFSDPLAYLVPTVMAATWLVAQAWMVRPQLRDSLVANAALLEGGVQEPVKEAEAERLRELASQPGWLENHWHRNA